MSTADDLGRMMAKELGDGPPARDRVRRRAAVVAAAERARTRRRLAWPLAAAAVLASATAAVVVLLPPAVGLWLEGSPGDRLAEGSTLAAPAATSLAVAFTDRSSLEVHAGTRARVRKASRGRVLIDVEKGVVSARVTPRTRLRWGFLAGAYEVTVTGTRLTVAREAGGDVAVAVAEGAVRVTGPGLTAGGTLVTAGHRLRARRGSSPELDPAADSPAPPHGSTAAEPEAQDAGTDAAASRPARPSDWRALARKREWAQAVAAAQRAGIDRIVATATPGDLALLADAARFSADGALARRLLGTLWLKHRGTDAGRLAPILLARLELDAKRFDEAVPWLERYIAANPSGSLRDEAHGRLVYALAEAGRTSAAQEAAAEYLTLFPSGEHASYARALLGRPR